MLTAVQGEMHMKLNGKYRLRKVNDSYVVVNLSGGELNLSRLITVNETGAFIFEKLAEEISMDELVDAIMEEYDIDRDGALNAAQTYVKKLADMGMAQL